MNGVGLFTLGLYTVIMAVFDIKPTVAGGIVCIGLGLMHMIFSSKRGKYD